MQCRTIQDRIKKKAKSKDNAGQCRTKNKNKDNAGHAGHGGHHAKNRNESWTSIVNTFVQGFP